MKSIFTFIAFFVISITSAQTNQKTIIKTEINCDHCKQCETCGQKFAGSMHKIKGLKMYDLDIENNQITVYFNPKKTDLQTIRESISKMGYDADDVKADSDSYALLDACCKKE